MWLAKMFVGCGGLVVACSGWTMVGSFRFDAECRYGAGEPVGQAWRGGLPAGTGECCLEHDRQKASRFLVKIHTDLVDQHTRAIEDLTARCRW